MHSHHTPPSRRDRLRWPRAALVGLVAASSAAGSGVRAEPPAPAAGSEASQLPPVTQSVAPDAPYAPTTFAPLRVEHRGTLRFRPELISGGHLGSDGSGVRDGLEADGRSGDTLGWASLRLRYRPVLHLGSQLAVSLGVDAPDNLVLGATHERATGTLFDGPFPVSDAQAPPSAGASGQRDGVRVREASLRARLFDVLDLDVGRGLDHFGLGVYRNDGGGLDADLGSVIDRVAASASVAGFRLDAAFEWTDTGVTSEHVAPSQPADGQPGSLGLADDATTWTLRVGRYARTPEELAARAATLDEQRAWSVEWGATLGLTSQTHTSSDARAATSPECAPRATFEDGRLAQPYDCVQLYRRGAELYRPGAWFSAELHPSLDASFRVAAEAQALVGRVDRVQRFLDDTVDDARAFSGFGLATEVTARLGRLGLGLDAGLATGDDGAHVGVLDGQDVGATDDAIFATDAALRANRVLTGFAFNRDYRLDLILFRQVLGAVTNAAYVKPWVSHDVLSSEALWLRARLDVLYAAAMRPSGTPGGGESWGLEVDGRLELGLAGGFEAQLAAGVLVPLGAFGDPLTNALPAPAFALRGIAAWRF
jgi:uncharacterized protein (TIGR04551 family)